MGATATACATNGADTPAKRAARAVAPNRRGVRTKSQDAATLLYAQRSMTSWIHSADWLVASALRGAW